MESAYLGSSQQPLYQVTESDRLLAVLSHVLTLFFSFFAPLIIYLLKKDESPFVREHAKESLNFQITLFIAYVVSILLIVVVIGIFMLMVLGIVHLVLVIVATVRASENKLYRYPFCIRLVQ